MRSYHLTLGNGRLALEASVCRTQGGIAVYLYGGDRPHIGSTVLAEPRTSLTGGGVSCTSGVMNLCGHKDELLARPLAELLCKRFLVPVNVCAGVHLDGAAEDELSILQNELKELGQMLMVRLAEEEEKV